MDKAEVSIIALEISEFIAMAEKFGITIGESDTVMLTNLRMMTEMMRRIVELESELKHIKNS